MKYNNILTLVENAYGSDNRSDNENKAIADYIDEIVEDITEFNADDFIVNGLTTVSMEEAQEREMTVIFQHEKYNPDIHQLERTGDVLVLAE